MVYDIRCQDFSLPPLTLQPIVENAVRHGVLRREEGGTVTIRTAETAAAYIVVIADDGVGIQPIGAAEGRSHIGIENVRSRLSVLCGGTLEIKSETGMGTTVTITVPKEEENAMTYIAVDDEPFALEDIADAPAGSCAGGCAAQLHRPGRALEYAESAPVDVAFLDIELGSMSGLVLAKKLKDLCPEIHIIFVTSHEQYAVKAFQLHATGYLMKPATAEDIRRELTFLYGESETRRRICVQTSADLRYMWTEQP